MSLSPSAVDRLRSSVDAAGYKHLLPALCIVLLCSFCLTACQGELKLKRAQEIAVAQLTVLNVDLRSGQSVLFVTQNTSAGCDPVLHLVNAAGAEVAFADNGGEGSNASLQYTATVSGSYQLVLRAKSNNTAGTCSITRDGTLLSTSATCGGTFLDLPIITSNEVVQVVRGPHGPNRHATLVFKLGSDHLEHYAEGQFTTSHQLPSEGNRIVALGIIPVSDAQYPFPGDSLRIYVNDYLRPGHDIDADGVGNELEAAIATCSDTISVVTDANGVPFECSCLADARDSDQDGISDGNELLGKGTTDAVPNTTVPLPAWGSDPRHKDLFVEADYMRELQADNESSRTERMHTQAARSFAQIYRDGFETDALVKLVNAMILQNPDRQAGISAHLDIGVPPEQASDVTIFGDWGGYTAVDAIPRDDEYGAQDKNVAWKAHMATNRRGLFRYLAGFAGGRGQNGDSSFAIIANFWDNKIPAHEMGHTFGLGHAGPYDLFGIYDPNCDPAYVSLMSYLFQNTAGVGFYGRQRSITLNNAAMQEYHAVHPTDLSVPYLQSTFEYFVDAEGSVDWDRDGEIAPSGATVRAYANRAVNHECECTRYNHVDLTNDSTTQSPAITVLGDTTFVFFADNTSSHVINYRTAVTDWDCPQPEKEVCGPVGPSAWHHAMATQLGSIGGFDVERLGPVHSNRLLLVSNWVNGYLWYSIYTNRKNTPGEWSPPNLVSTTTKASGAPDIIALDDDHILLAYKGEDQVLRTRIFNRLNGRWDPETIALSSAVQGQGTPIQLTPASSPGLVQAVLAPKPGVPAIYGAFNMTPSSRLVIFVYDPVANNWQPTTLLPSSVNVFGRPSMAWVPEAGHAHIAGHLYLVYHTSQPPGAPQMMISYIKRNGASQGLQELIGLPSDFDNSDLHTYGSFIYYDPYVGHPNLRFAGCIPKGGPDLFNFRPKADGINDAPYWATNDWLTITKNVARVVANPGGTVNNPIRYY